MTFNEGDSNLHRGLFIDSRHRRTYSGIQSYTSLNKGLTNFRTVRALELRKRIESVTGDGLRSFLRMNGREKPFIPNWKTYLTVKTPA